MRLVWMLTCYSAAAVPAGVEPSISMNVTISSCGGTFGVETLSLEFRLDDIVSSFSQIFNLLFDELVGTGFASSKFIKV